MQFFIFIALLQNLAVVVFKQEQSLKKEIMENFLSTVF